MLRCQKCGDNEPVLWISMPKRKDFQAGLKINTNARLLFPDRKDFVTTKKEKRDKRFNSLLTFVVFSEKKSFRNFSKSFYL